MRRRMGIKTLILLMGLLPTLLLTLGFSSYLVYHNLQTVQKVMIDSAMSSAAQISALSAVFYERNDRQTLGSLADAALETPNLRAITLYDESMRALYHAGPSQQTPELKSDAPLYSRGTNGDVYVLSPVFASNVTKNEEASPTGWVYMSFQSHDYQLLKYRTLLIAIIAFCICIIFAVAIVGKINQRLSLDTGSIRRGLRKLTGGAKNVHLHLPGNDALSEIANDLNDLNRAHQREMRDLRKSVEQSTFDLQETLETVEIQNIELDFARREAVEASRIKSEFLANTSHEVRTPLNSIIGFSNVLLKTDLNARQREAVETMRGAAGNLLTIINDILDFSKLEAGKLVLDSAPVSIRELAEDALLMQAPSAHEKQLELALVIDHDVPDTVLADPLRLKQVFTNLISNAIKFTPSGHILVAIQCVESSANDVLLNVRVEDTGIGLSLEQQKHVFRDFAQADASVTRQYGGTGLGLVIVKKLLEQMGGEIGISSETGGGATFWFTLKFALPDQQLYLRQFSTLSGKSVALYSRSELQRRSLQNLFESWGMTVHSTALPEDLHSGEDYRVLSLGFGESVTALDIQRDDKTVILGPQPCHDENDVNCRNYLGAPVSHTRLYDTLTGKGYSANKESALPVFPGKSVLIVDDNPSNLLILATLLREAEVTIEQAQNGLEAVRECQNRRFDLILMDIQMPQVDGIQASKEIRGIGLNTQTPIVAVSAYLAPENPQQLREAGIDQYMTKPIGERQLYSVLRRYLANEDTYSTRPTVTSRPVDISECLRKAKKRPELAKEMLGLLLDELPHQVQSLRDAARNENWQLVSEINHKLKGSCCYTGVPLLSDAVSVLESLLESDTSALDVIAITTALESLFSAATALLAWRNEHTVEDIFN